jgi:signal transduction histidine kinase
MAQTAPSQVAGAKIESGFAVLVIDGNEEHQILSVTALTRTGCHVRTAGSGKEALQLAIEQPFDAFVIGSKLRDSAGVELIQVLRDRFPDVPKMFVVPPEAEEAAVRAMRSGATSYIVKTPRYTELLPTLVAESIQEARNRRRLAESEESRARVLTERREVEQRLSESETRLRMILRQVPVLLWSTDRDLRVTSALGGGFRSLDTARREERGLSLFEYFDAPDADREPIASHRRALDGESVSAQMEWQGRQYDVHIEPLRSSEGTIVGTIGVALDVSDRLGGKGTRTSSSSNASAQVHRLAGSERVAAMARLTEFIAHELNTPLTSISLLTSAAAKRTSDPVALGKLEKIAMESHRASEIIRDLLELVKTRRRNSIETDLRAIVASAVEQARRKRKKSVQVDVEVGDAPIRAVVDPLQIQEVVMNLVENGIDATSKGTVHVRVEERPEAHAIIVSDTGSGMTPEVQARLFEPFFTTKPHGKGVGLGLLLANHIVMDHGGTLEVSSKPGSGSTFTVLLPREGGR